MVNYNRYQQQKLCVLDNEYECPVISNECIGFCMWTLSMITPVSGEYKVTNNYKNWHHYRLVENFGNRRVQKNGLFTETRKILTASYRWCSRAIDNKIIYAPCDTVKYLKNTRWQHKLIMIVELSWKLFFEKRNLKFNLL